MMKRNLLSILLLSVFALTTLGQDTEAMKKEINQVKKNPGKYLYVEMLDSIESEALAKARHALNEDIDDYVRQQKNLKNAPNIIARNIKTKTLTMKRGSNRYRAFAYVSKSDILPADNVVVRKNEQAAANSNGGSKVEPITGKREETIEKLLSLKFTNEVIPTLKQLKKDGRIADFANHSSLQNPDGYVFIIHNKEGKVEAVLSEGPQRTNLKTGDPDGTANYKGRGAIGVKVNN